MSICLDTSVAARAVALRASALGAPPALVVETGCGRARPSEKSQSYCCPWQLRTAGGEASDLSKLVGKEAEGHRSKVVGMLRSNRLARI